MRSRLMLSTDAAVTTLSLKSVRFNSADSAYMNWTPAGAGNRKTWTFSCWVKRSKLGTYQWLFAAESDANNRFAIIFTDTDAISWGHISGGSSVGTHTTGAVYRDPSAWYHIVLVVDTTQATAGNRERLYVNGVEVSAFSTNTDITQNADTFVNNNVAHAVSKYISTSPYYYFDGYLSDIYLVDGAALTPGDFAETHATTGQWVPKLYTGSLGTNGRHYDFSDGSSAAALGYDYGAGTNDATVNNISVAAGAGNDWLADSPTNNYCTLNPLNKSDYVLPLNGNLDCGGNAYSHQFSTFVFTTGKWYAEQMVGGSDGTIYPAFGVHGGSYLCFIGGNGQRYANDSWQAYLSSFTMGDIQQVAVDFDAGKAWFGRNGSFNGDPAAGTGGLSLAGAGTQYYFYTQTNAAGDVCSINFGARAFAYTPLTGFLALCTANLPEPSIVKSNTAFDAKTRTGTGAAASVTGLAFQPGIAWIKSRSAATDHALYATLAKYRLETNNNEMQANETSDGVGFGVESFNSDGISIGTLAQANTNAATYVDWLWKEDPACGVDIKLSSKTGTSPQSYSHALGVKPELIIVKRTSSGTADWYVTHKNLGAEMQDYYLKLNNTDAATNSNDFWGGEPTSSLFYISNSICADGGSFMGLLFASVPGFSKIGSYVGNGSADGPFVFCGFRPKWVLYKMSSSSGTSWQIHDSARNTYNLADLLIRADGATAEADLTGSGSLDFTATGFKIRSSNANCNTNAGTFIVLAFAEAPFKYARAR